MRQTVSMTSTYSSDEFGICSALYELGGMVVMHDASGCNSTYTTHDEPRWYDMDSMIYISAISEMEAVMGDDEKFIHDVVETARVHHPKFIALVGAPIPYMIGTDFEAIARVVEQETGIPCMGFQANGMNYYTKGISMALAELVKRFGSGNENRGNKMMLEAAGITHAIRVNLLGVTPLDFAWKHTLEDLRSWLEQQGMILQVSLSMGCCQEDLARLAEADVNLVLSTGGMEAARQMEETMGIPYVVGVPYGRAFAQQVAETLRQTSQTGVSQFAYPKMADIPGDRGQKRILMIGEAVTTVSLAEAIAQQYGVSAVVADPLTETGEFLRACDVTVDSEEQIRQQIALADVIIADPLYRPLAKKKVFIDMPHTAFSGRICEKRMPRMIGRELEIEKELIC